jgi:hypothetical protein
MRGDLNSGFVNYDTKPCNKMATTGRLDVQFITEAVPPKQKSRWNRERMGFPRRIQHYTQWVPSNASLIHVAAGSVLVGLEGQWLYQGNYKLWQDSHRKPNGRFKAERLHYTRSGIWSDSSILNMIKYVPCNRKTIEFNNSSSKWCLKINVQMSAELS